MDHAKRSGSAKAEKLLRLAAHFLSRRDFPSCRKLALLARNADPSNSASDQILAVAEVLLATDHQNPPDWHSILQLTRRPDSEDPTLVRTQFEKLKTLLEPSTNGFAFSREAIELVEKAQSFLFVPDPGKKTHFGNGSETPKQRRGNGGVGRGYNGEETFWTVCPYCYYMFEYRKVYEDCCLRCQNCRKAFHGVAIEAPPPDILVEGKEQYTFCFGYFQMGFVDPNKKKEKGRQVIDEEDKGVVIISDDDDVDGYFEEVVKSGGSEGGELRKEEGKIPVRRVKMLARRMKSTRVKSVARSTKKITGNGLRSRRIKLEEDEREEGVEMSVEDRDGIDEGEEGGSGSGSGIGGLEFFEEEDDIYVGIGDSPI